MRIDCSEHEGAWLRSGVRGVARRFYCYFLDGSAGDHVCVYVCQRRGVEEREGGLEGEGEGGVCVSHIALVTVDEGGKAQQEQMCVGHI